MVLFDSRCIRRRAAIYVLLLTQLYPHTTKLQYFPTLTNANRISVLRIVHSTTYVYDVRVVWWHSNPA